MQKEYIFKCSDIETLDEENSSVNMSSSIIRYKYSALAKKFINNYVQSLSFYSTILLVLVCNYTSERKKFLLNEKVK